MFTAIILMCTLNGQCYTITNTTGFYENEPKCQESVYQLLQRPDFPALFENVANQHYMVTDVRCINWDDKPI